MIRNDIWQPTDATVMQLIDALRYYDESLHGQMEVPHIEICSDGSGSVGYREKGNGRMIEYGFIGIDEAIAWCMADDREYDNA